jgi:hypothetical protein
MKRQRSKSKVNWASDAPREENLDKLAVFHLVSNPYQTEV